MNLSSRIAINILLIVFLHVFIVGGFSQNQMLESKMHHLRTTNQPEWSDFPGEPLKRLELTFDAHQNKTENTLKLIQADVRQAWRIILNDAEIGRLAQDENKMTKYIPIPPFVLREGSNRIVIEQADTATDDISVGQLSIGGHSIQQVLGEASLLVSVKDKKTHSPLPCKITIVDSNRALQSFNTAKNDVAVRTGCIYSANGKATFTLPRGKYTIYASRGCEYSADSSIVVLTPGDNVEKKFAIEREVPTKGWIAADPHTHTFTYSFHGDATMQERMLTIAGEGIELPVITEHNALVDVDSIATAMKVRSYFTPVIGDEYTTAAGHFNVFPLTKSINIPEHRNIKDWNNVAKNLRSFADSSAIILNHARDVHNNFRPFDPKRHISVAGIELDNHPFPANAMEVMNSGSQQKDIMQLFYDWFGMLNGGKQLTPVGSSDSHDVNRFLVGQSRTYIKYPDDEPGKIDIHNITDQFLKGKVMVSFGLLTEIEVNGKYEPGDLAIASENANAAVRVLGPGWLKADKICLYANGKKIREAIINDDKSKGVKWSGSWNIPVPRHDVFLVAIAEGPGQTPPFWQIPKPYQRTSPDWHPKIIGASGAVWIDGDKDGKKTSAFDYANKIISVAKNNLEKIIAELANYDEAVSTQVAAILYKRGISLATEKLKKLLMDATPVVKRGFKAFTDELPDAFKNAK